LTIFWRYLRADGSACGESGTFDDRMDAEAWLSEEWQSLVGVGVEAIALVSGDGDELYRMSLQPGPDPG